MQELCWAAEKGTRCQRTSTTLSIWMGKSHSADWANYRPLCLFWNSTKVVKVLSTARSATSSNRPTMGPPCNRLRHNQWYPRYSSPNREARSKIRCFSLSRGHAMSISGVKCGRWPAVWVNFPSPSSCINIRPSSCLFAIRCRHADVQGHGRIQTADSRLVEIVLTPLSWNGTHDWCAV